MFELETRQDVTQALVNQLLETARERGAENPVLRIEGERIVITDADDSEMVFRVEVQPCGEDRWNARSNGSL